MNRSRRFWWTVYASCVLAVVVALVWVSTMLLGLEREYHTSHHHSKFNASLGLALWRMDSWMLPVLSRESSRPHYEYLSYYPLQRTPVEAFGNPVLGDRFGPSPLLGYRPEFIHLHFQVDPSGAITSPQSPPDPFENAAMMMCVNDMEIVTAREGLQRMSDLLDLKEMHRLLDEADAEEERLLADGSAERALGPVVMEGDTDNRWIQPFGTKLAEEEQAARQKTARAASRAGFNDGNFQNNLVLTPTLANGELDAETVTLGPMVSMWVGPDRDELILARRVLLGASEYIQGVHFNWPKLHEAMLAEVSDLLRSATLRPRVGTTLVAAGEGELTESSATGTASARTGDGAEEIAEGMSRLELASVPASLFAARPPVPALEGFTPAEATVAVTWSAVLLALLVAGVMLRSAVEFGDRRSRFASAVTHELRTPLTTFRMYSEMLADGMVRDEAQRSLYYHTLKDESARLAVLVENVLSYARVEDGRTRPPSEAHSVADLVGRALTPLQRRCEEAGMTLDVDFGDAADVKVRADVESVGQILFNLVDNACKYATNGSEALVHLRAEQRCGRVFVSVHDHGPGISGDDEATVFRAFERAGHDGDAAPGIGLGLALARGLARNNGGELRLGPSGGEGACFVLEFPQVS